MALETHPNGSKGMDKENLSWVAGVEVEIKKAERYDDGKGRRGEGRGKERLRLREYFFERKIKRYEDQLGSKLEQQPFPGNGARKLVGYFNDAN